ncbi:putative sugar nucleotidyltransferase [Magnetospirillum sp. XM-1]|uniref:phosphocholine cytidylyltransferase family protein n=1 Tax=Magnetospirillum sp. XM-1 TaxID=1663591 RepID=UPI00073DF934|nr:phosphocholine cytidylyltransferase family protein [Magnetospirillum sp. XM-1]CUW39522.1 putative sugar nucleotidyltransferase [Magnetospirillum sp. XM-1]
MKALILAAGRGSRMRSYTEDRPKGLVEVAGKPLLHRQIDALKAAGITEVGVVSGYKAEMLKDRGLTLFHNPRWAETNMVTSLSCAEKWLKFEPVLVSYSDIFYKAEAVSALMKTPSDIAITYDPHWQDLWSRRFSDPLSDAETFRFAPNGQLCEIGTRPTSLDHVQGQYMGLLRFTPAGWERAMAVRASLKQESCDHLDMTSLLRILLERGDVIDAIPSPWPWGEVDSEMDLTLYESDPKSFGLSS